jgi:hypothetical protein
MPTTTTDHGPRSTEQRSSPTELGELQLQLLCSPVPLLLVAPCPLVVGGPTVHTSHTPSSVFKLLTNSKSNELKRSPAAPVSCEKGCTCAVY